MLFIYLLFPLISFLQPFGPSFCHGLPFRGLAITLINLLKPTFHVMHQQFNIQQLYALPTQYLCVLYLSENKQLLVALTP
jgi:hypothetical protein